jgi:hypothetical protein
VPTVPVPPAVKSTPKAAPWIHADVSGPEWARVTIIGCLDQDESTFFENQRTPRMR